MFSQEVADAICELLAGGKSLRAACVEVGANARTVLDWTKANEAFSAQYAKAREAGYALLADELIEISDEKEVEARYQGDDVKLELSASAIARNRLRVDTRKWMLSKMLPKVYGDKQTIDVNDVTPKTPEQVNTRIAELMAKAAKQTGG